MMPRAANISSTMRRPSGNRKYSQIAWLMISAGKRWPAYGERAGVAIPLGYPARSATASPSARNLTVPGGAVVIDHAAREAGEDRRADCAPRALRRVPAGRGGGAAGAVR